MIKLEDKDELKKILLDSELTISVAESLTSGLIQNIFGDISGASGFYRGGLTAYSIDSKEEFLGVYRKHAESCDCVSERVVKEMAIGVCEHFDSDIGLATTGYAEPSIRAGSPMAYIAVYFRETDKLEIRKIVGRDEKTNKTKTRNEMREFVAEEVFKLLLDQLKAII